MSDTAWAHLPNAKHIDAVLTDAHKRKGAWSKAQRDMFVSWPYQRNVLWTAAYRTALADMSLDASVWASSLPGTLRGVITALMYWDSSADLLECTPDVLRAMIDLAEPPVCHQAVLLLPYAIVRMHV